jgi:hypothetical protein
MEDTPKTYFMILRRPWLKQAKAHHNWGNNILTIIIDTKIITLSTLKRIIVYHSQKPCNLDDNYD